MAVRHRLNSGITNWSRAPCRQKWSDRGARVLSLEVRYSPARKRGMRETRGAGRVEPRIASTDVNCFRARRAHCPTA